MTAPQTAAEMQAGGIFRAVSAYIQRRIDKSQDEMLPLLRAAQSDYAALESEFRALRDQLAAVLARVDALERERR